MAKLSEERILIATGELFASGGSELFSIRNLAKKLDVSPSVIYYYFDDEQQLLRSMFDHHNRLLGQKRGELPRVRSAKRMLEQRIDFQIEHQQIIVAVLKYYQRFRHTFPKHKTGFVPDKSALHIEEVLQFGINTGEFSVHNLEDDAKFIAHAINGFLLEFHPYVPAGRERKRLVSSITSFVVRALKP
jgi:AcrR family transcriptional regulator